ncbi:hypothetical protein [Pedobacter chinensis]
MLTLFSMLLLKKRKLLN